MSEWFFSALKIDGQPMDQAMVEIETKQLMQKFDDGDGKISFPEFERIFAERAAHLKVKRPHPDPRHHYFTSHSRSHLLSLKLKPARITAVFS